MPNIEDVYAIKKKDIEDFEKYAKKLVQVLERIRTYCPTALVFVNGEDSIHLMTDYWFESGADPNDYSVASVSAPGFDGGGF